MRAGIRTVDGLPLNLSGAFADADISIRGEIFMTEEQLADINEQLLALNKLKNARRERQNERRRKMNETREEHEKVSETRMEAFAPLKTTRNATAGQLNPLHNFGKLLERLQKAKAKVERGEVEPTENYAKLLDLARKLLGEEVVG
jgi:NAD-dependent DNA ligase